MLKGISLALAMLAVALFMGATVAWTLDGGLGARQDPNAGVPQANQVPFDVLEPGSLPEGYELAHQALIRRGQNGALTDEQAQEVTGVVQIYLESEPEAGTQMGTILLEQRLGTKFDGYEIAHASKTGTETIRGFSTDVWDARNINDVPQVIFVWEDADLETYYTMVTYLSLAEARTVAASLR